MSNGIATQSPAATESDPTAVVASISAFVDTITDAFEAVDAPDEIVAAVTESGDQLTTQVESALTATGEDIDQLEAELQQERETRAKEAAEDRQRIHDVETRVDEAIDDDAGDTTGESDPTGGSEPATPGVEPPKTPLEDVIRVPDHLIGESLTANQRRARFVAKDIHEYTRRVPAGQAITSSELRRVLAAGEDAQIYTETVSRVIRFLNELGGDAVKIRESKRGERVVVFTEAFVERVQAYQSQATSDSNTVVTGGEVSG